jgi:rod shape-determining protein MreD
MIRAWWRYFCILFFLLLLQTTPLLPLGSYGARPDFLLFFVLFVSIALPAGTAACLVFMIGYCFEAVSGSPAGLFISTYLLIFAAIKVLCLFFNFNTLIELFGLLLICLAVKYLLVCFFMFFIYEYHYEAILRTVVNETFFTLILFPVFFPLIRKFGTMPQKKVYGPRDSYTHAA